MKRRVLDSWYKEYWEFHFLAFAKDKNILFFSGCLLN